MLSAPRRPTRGHSPHRLEEQTEVFRYAFLERAAQYSHGHHESMTQKQSPLSQFRLLSNLSTLLPDRLAFPHDSAREIQSLQDFPRCRDAQDVKRDTLGPSYAFACHDNLFVPWPPCARGRVDGPATVWSYTP
jgi:hypothetical protein